jgi:hypothetical protein
MSPRSAPLLSLLALLSCKRDVRPTPLRGALSAASAIAPEPAPARASAVAPTAASPASPAAAAPSSSPAPAAPSSSPAPVGRAFSMTLPGGNSNPFGKPNLWAYVPAAFRADRPLRLVFVFHGFSSCIESFVGPTSLPCKPWDAPRTAADLPAQIERSRTGALVLVPQLAYDERLGDPGVLHEGAALERLTREALEGPLADAIGARRLDDVERVAMIAVSGGYQALFAALGPEPKAAFGDKLRDVALLDAYYAEASAIDAWLWRNLTDFDVEAARPRHLAVVYSGLPPTRGYAQAFAARAALELQREGLAASLLHRDVAREPTVEELAVPVSFLFSSKEHDDIPRADIARAISAFGI